LLVVSWRVVSAVSYFVLCRPCSNIYGCESLRVATVQTDGKEGFAKVRQLREEVQKFATKWPLPGVDVSTLTKPEGILE